MKMKKIIFALSFVLMIFPAAIAAQGEIPKQLFDINLEIDEYSVADIKELTLRVIFISFGRMPTPVNLTFTIENEAGEKVHVEKDYIVVETEAVFTKKFKGLKLAPGKYALLLDTLYYTDVRDEFSQDFEIIKGRFSILGSIWFWALVAAILIIVVAFIVRIKKKRRYL